MKFATLFLLCTLGWPQDVPAVLRPGVDLYEWRGHNQCYLRAPATWTCSDPSAALLTSVDGKVHVCHPLKVEAKPSPESRVRNDMDTVKPRSTSSRSTTHPQAENPLVVGAISAIPLPAQMDKVSVGGRRSGQRADDCESDIAEYWQARFNLVGIPTEQVCKDLHKWHCLRVSYSFTPVTT